MKGSGKVFVAGDPSTRRESDITTITLRPEAVNACGAEWDPRPRQEPRSFRWHLVYTQSGGRSVLNVEQRHACFTLAQAMSRY